MKRSPVEATPARALPAEGAARGGRSRGDDEGCFEQQHLPPQPRARNSSSNNTPTPLHRPPRKEQQQQVLPPDYGLSQELTSSTFDGSNTSWSSSGEWSNAAAPRGPPKGEQQPGAFYGKYQGPYHADWSAADPPSYGVMHQQSPPPPPPSASSSSSSYYDANDYYGGGGGYGYGGYQQQQQQGPYGGVGQQQYPPAVLPYNGNRTPSSCPPGKQMVPDYRRQNRFGFDAHGRIQHIKREPEDGGEQDGENFTSLFTKSLTSLYSQDAENAFPDESAPPAKSAYDSPDVMVLEGPRMVHPAHLDDGYHRGYAAAGFPHGGPPRQNFGGYYENRNQIPEPAPSVVVHDLGAEAAERVNAFRYDRPSFDDMHLYASSPSDAKGHAAKKRKLSAPGSAADGPEAGCGGGGGGGKRKGPRLASFKSDSKWTPNSFAFAAVSIKQEPLDEDGAAAEPPPGSSNGRGAPAAEHQPPGAQPPKSAARKRSPGTTCFDRFEKKSTPASKKVSPLSVYAKVQDSVVLSVKCRRYKKRTKPIAAAKEDAAASYPGREEIENWKRTGAYSQSPDQAVRLLMGELVERVSHLGDRGAPEGPEPPPPVDIAKARELLYQFCKRYSVDYSDFENTDDLRPRMIVTEPTKNFERASAIRKRTNISPVRSKTPPQAESSKTPKATRKVEAAARPKAASEFAKPANKRILRKLPGRAERGRKLRGTATSAAATRAPVVTRRYSTRSAKEDSDVDIVIDSSTDDNESEAGKEAEVPKKSRRLKNRHPVVEAPAKAINPRQCVVRKDDAGARPSRGRRPEAELAPLKKKWSRLHETESRDAGRRCQPVVVALSRDAVKTEPEKNSVKPPPKTSSRKSADKIICDSVLSSPTFNLFSRQTRRKSFDVVEIDCDDKEVKPFEDKCFVKLVKHGETRSCDKPSIKKEPPSPPGGRRGTSRDSVPMKTRLKSWDALADSRRSFTARQGSLKSEKYGKNSPSAEVDAQKKDEKQGDASSTRGKNSKEADKAPFHADLSSGEESPAKQNYRDRTSSESEKRQTVISKLEGRLHRKDVPKALEKKPASAGKTADSDKEKDTESSSPKKNEYSRFMDKTDSVVQIKLTKLPINFTCEGSSFKSDIESSSPENSFKIVFNSRQSKSKLPKTQSRSVEPDNSSEENETGVRRATDGAPKSKPEAFRGQSHCDKTDGEFRVEDESFAADKTRSTSGQSQLEVPLPRRRSSSRGADDEKGGGSPESEIPRLKPKIPAPKSSFDLRGAIAGGKCKGRSDDSSDERKGDDADESPGASEPPKLDCMTEDPPEPNNGSSKQNESSAPALEERSPDSNSIVCMSMPSIFPISSAQENGRPQTISLHRRSDSDDSDCGGLVIDLDRRQSVEDRVPSPTFPMSCSGGGEPKPSPKDPEPAVMREPTPSTSGYSSTSRASNKSVWGLDDSDDDDDCIVLEGGGERARRPRLDITFASLESAAKEHAKKIKDREESILRSLLLDNADAAAPGTSQEQSQSPAYNISAESRAKIRNNVMRIIMYQANHEVSATTAAGGFDLKKIPSSSLPTDLNGANIAIEDGDEEAENPVDAKERIRRLKNEIVYLQCMAEQKDQERTAIVCFKRYKEEVLRRLIKEYAFNVQDHVRDWLNARQDSDPDGSRTPSGTQASPASFATSLANEEELDRLWNEFIVWVENRSLLAQQNTDGTTTQPEFSLADQVLQLAYRASSTTTAASGSTAAKRGDSEGGGGGEQLPAVATMVASATENYGVDMRTMRNGGAGGAAPTTTQTILQKALSSSIESAYSSAALRDPVHRPSTSRSLPSSDTSTSSTLHHQKQSFQIYRKTTSSTFRSGGSASPTPPDRGRDRPQQPFQKSSSPPSLQPELRQPVPKIFSPQPAEKQYPLDLIVTTSATVTIETAPVTCEAPVKKRGHPLKLSDGPVPKPQSSSRRNPEAASVEGETAKSEGSHRATKYEGHFAKCAAPPPPVAAKTDAVLPPRDFAAKSDAKKAAADFPFGGKPEGEKPGPSSKEVPFGKGGAEGAPKNRRVTSSPKRRPGGYSYSAWSAQNGRSAAPEAAPAPAATLDLRTDNARAKDASPLLPKKDTNGHHSQKFMVVPPPTTLQKSCTPPGGGGSSHQTRSHSSHHHEASHKSGIERVYGLNTEDELRPRSFVDSGGGGGVPLPLPYPANGGGVAPAGGVGVGGLAFPLVKITLSMPTADEEGGAGCSGVKCLGCGVSDAKFLCSGCRKHWYCSAHCQTMRWPEHSRDCGRFYE